MSQASKKTLKGIECSQIALEQIDLFVNITTTELEQKVLELEQLLKRELTLSKLVSTYGITMDKLEEYFPIVNTRDEIDQYCNLYSLGPPFTFLFAKGLLPVNVQLDELMTRLRSEFEQLQTKMFECVFALNLLAAPVDRRDIFDHSFLELAITKFKAYEDWALDQVSNFFTAHLQFYSQQILSISRAPQLVDRRVSFMLAERVFYRKEIIGPVKSLFGVYLKLVDYLDKNQDKLNVLLTEARLFHQTKVQRA